MFFNFLLEACPWLTCCLKMSSLARSLSTTNTICSITFLGVSIQRSLRCEQIQITAFDLVVVSFSWLIETSYPSSVNWWTEVIFLGAWGMYRTFFEHKFPREISPSIVTFQLPLTYLIKVEPLRESDNNELSLVTWIVAPESTTNSTSWWVSRKYIYSKETLLLMASDE